MQAAHILCLEDNKDDAELIAHQLEKMASRPKLEHVSSADEYRDRIARKRYDLILSDYSIPGFSGIEALNIARNLTPDTPFIFFSGTLGEDAAIESLLQGATDYVVKQRPARLPVAITRALEEAESKRQQRSAQESLRFQADILNSVSEGVIATDSAGRVVFWNPGAESIFGRSAHSVMMEQLQGVGIDVESGSLGRLIQTVIECGQANETVWCYSSVESSPVWVSIAARRLTDSKNAPLGFLLIANDVSERKSWEDQMIGLNADLEARVVSRTAELVEANEECQKFGYSVSHDLHAPLRAMAGYARVLTEDFSDQLGKDGLQIVTRIAAAAVRMDQISKGLLRLATLSGSPLESKVLDLSRFARQVAAELMESAPDRAVDWTVQSNLTVKADEALTRSLLENLMSNAWKFTADQANANIEIGKEDTDRGPAYFVRDNGIGFDPDEVKQIFEPFHRLHGQREYPGVGVGLSTAIRIAKRHHGQMWAVGSPGMGATFYFTLGPPAQGGDCVPFVKSSDRHSIRA